MINCEGRVEYGPKFQVIKVLAYILSLVQPSWLHSHLPIYCTQEARINSDSTSIVGILNYDNGSWSKRGGIYGIPLLDGILQLGFLIPVLDAGSVVLAGGFEIGVFARRPTGDTCVVVLEASSPIPDGATMITGNAWMYDSNGSLLVYLQGIKRIYAQNISGVQDVFQVWQPLATAENHSKQLLKGQRTIASCVFQ